MRIRFLHLFIFVFCIVSFSFGKVLIFDLGDVLFRQSRWGFSHSIGIRRLLAYSLADLKWPNPQPLLFQVLDTFGKQEVTDESQVVCAPNGIPLPQIFCDWLAGKIHPDVLIRMVHERIEELDFEDFFISAREKNLIKRSVTTIFSPAIFSHNSHPIHAGVNLLKECSAYQDEQGEPHTLIVLSNLDPHSFKYIFNNNSAIFEHFDHISISGKTGFLKPFYSCYQNLLTTYNLKPEDCYLIDDQWINIRSAEQLNMHGLWLKNGNFRSLRKRMQKLGLI